MSRRPSWGYTNRHRCRAGRSQPGSVAFIVSGVGVACVATHLLDHDQHFVIRLGHDRRLQGGRGKVDAPYLFESLSDSRFRFKRTVQLSRRKATKCRRKERIVPGRESRVARLEIRAGSREIYRNHGAAPHIPHSLRLNFVEVREPSPPSGEQPVVWRLATTEPIDTREQVARVVDAYRTRWTIEEFFKALKTGCRYQQLQLESMRALVTALAIEVAVAWKLLLLRWAAKPESEADCMDALGPEQMEVLRRWTDMDLLDGKSVLLAVARLGGHLRNNGAPGWLTLRRGMDKLAVLHQGWSLARRSHRRISRSDQ